MANNQASITAHAAVHARQSRIEWMWKSNAVPRSSSEPEEWCCYSDIETAIIEEAYANKLSEAVLDDYHVSFEHLVQISNKNNNDQRPVKRAISECKGAGVRQERFLSNPLSPSMPFGNALVGPFKLSVRRHFNLPSYGWNILEDKTVRRMMVEQAAAGFIVEGKMLGKQKEGEWLSRELLSVKEGTMKEVWECCIRLYCKESFIYKEMNKYMRLAADKKYEAVWTSKVPTYGPLAFILSDHVWDSCDEIMTVYRGADLPDELIEQFRHRARSGTNFWGYRFPAFTSTSRNIDTAEFLAGNALFVIEIHSHDGDDVSSY